MHVKRRSGFTLIELLVVVLIIGILSAIALPQYQKAVARARLAQVLTTLNALEKGLEVYHLQHRYNRTQKQGEELLSALDIEIPDITCTGNTCTSDLGGGWTARWNISRSYYNRNQNTDINGAIYSPSNDPYLAFYSRGNYGDDTTTKTKGCAMTRSYSISRMWAAQLASLGWACRY